MLSEKQKSQIEAEEIFRAEIREQLSKAKSKTSWQSKLWVYLNSSFVLWFLSSIIVASITALYANYQSNRAENFRKSESIRKLDTEISNRIYQAYTGLRSTQLNIDTNHFYTHYSIYSNEVAYLNNSFVNSPDNPVDFSIYPEYKSRTFWSLIYERKSLEGINDIDDAFIAIDSLSYLGSLRPVGSNKTMKQSVEEVKNTYRLLNRYLGKRSWQVKVPLRYSNFNSD